MLEVSQDGVIELTRGDTAKLSVDISNDVTGVNYEIDKEDTLRFTVKKSATVKDVVLQKICIGDTLIHIKPEDTKDLSYGTYIYDVELTTKNGDVYTVIPPTKFVLAKEVTW